MLLERSTGRRRAEDGSAPWTDLIKHRAPRWLTQECEWKQAALEPLLRDRMGHHVGPDLTRNDGCRETPPSTCFSGPGDFEEPVTYVTPPVHGDLLLICDR